MNSGRTVFSQLISFLPDREFRRCVARYGGNHRLREFSCWDQYLTLAFAQLTYRESLRDIEACLRSLQGKLYHTGFRGRVSRSTLADANENRDWRIFADFAQVLTESLCFGLHHDRSLSLAVSLGSLPQAQGRRQTAHAARPSRQYSHFHPRNRGQNARCEHSLRHKCCNDSGTRLL